MITVREWLDDNEVCPESIPLWEGLADLPAAEVFARASTPLGLCLLAVADGHGPSVGAVAWLGQRSSVYTIRGADLRGADLRGAKLREANLCEADLRGADLGGADLRGADLRGADLRGACLDLGGLREADLREADLRGADLKWADLRRANLRYTDLRGATLPKRANR